MDRRKQAKVTSYLKDQSSKVARRELSPYHVIAQMMTKPPLASAYQFLGSGPQGKNASSICKFFICCMHDMGESALRSG